MGEGCLSLYLIPRSALGSLPEARAHPFLRCRSVWPGLGPAARAPRRPGDTDRTRVRVRVNLNGHGDLGHRQIPIQRKIYDHSRARVYCMYTVQP